MFSSVTLYPGDAEPLPKTEEYVCYMNDEMMKMPKHYRYTASGVYIPKQAMVNVVGSPTHNQ